MYCLLLSAAHTAPLCARCTDCIPGGSPGGYAGTTPVESDSWCGVGILSYMQHFRCQFVVHSAYVAGAVGYTDPKDSNLLSLGNGSGGSLAAGTPWLASGYAAAAGLVQSANRQLAVTGKDGGPDNEKGDRFGCFHTDWPGKPGAGARGRFLPDARLGHPGGQDVQDGPDGLAAPDCPDGWRS